jgi:3-dehydroquinate dehydratase-2
MTTTVLIVNGPNLNMLGKREPEIYGQYTLDQLEKELTAHCQRSGVEAVCFQSNSEEKLIEFIQERGQRADWLVINPGGLTHTSVALRDAILSVKIKTIEVHISNIFRREEFRRLSYISDIAEGVISGLGVKGYFLAVDSISKK